MSIRNFLFKKKTATAEVDWEAVYDELLPRVYNFFRYRVGQEDTAEELTAVTLERAWRSRKRYKADQSAFSTWTLGIARNVAADYWRKQRPVVPLDEVVETHAADFSVEQTLQKRHDLAELMHHLAKLTVQEQELIALKYGASMTNRAIAQVTDLSESNVGTILHRVVKKLRVEMGVGAEEV